MRPRDYKGPSPFINNDSSNQFHFESFFVHLELTAVGNDDLLGGGAAVGANLLHLLDNIDALNDFAEHYVLSVQPGSGSSANEELASVG